MDPFLSQEATNFLLEHDLAVLSTVDANGAVCGAVVYYVGEEEGHAIYVVSRSESTKVKNIQEHKQVALTIYDAPEMKTLQLSGTAEVAGDTQQLQRIFQLLVHERPYQGEMLMPPVTALAEGDYVLLKITPSSGNFSDYKDIIKKKALKA